MSNARVDSGEIGTVEKAVIVIKKELETHRDLYKGFKASIESALRDLPEESDLPDAAEHILRRIIGEE